MARPRNNAKHLHAAVEGLVAAVTSLLSTIEASMPRAGAAGQGAKGAKGAKAAGHVPAKRGPGKNNPKLKAAIAASWARMTPAERKERVRRMLAGRGIKPKKA